jgi:hypothetical protein
MRPVFLIMLSNILKLSVLAQNVGIGVDQSQIPVESKLVIGAVNNVSEGGQIQLNAPGATYTTAFFLDNYENRFRVMTGTNTGSSITRLAIANSGNVGIGTDAPLSKLHIVGGTGNALELEGGIRVSGSSRAIFQITADASNLSDFFDGPQYLRISNTFANSNPTAILIVTPEVTESVITVITPAVFYRTSNGRWYIKNQANVSGSQSVLAGQKYNVMVVDY